MNMPIHIAENPAQTFQPTRSRATPACPDITGSKLQAPPGPVENWLSG